jgi:transmembrane sensor
MAASIAAVAILGIGYATDLPVKLQADALTRRGEMHSVKLDDGSEIILNSGSAVAFDYSKQERRIRLLRGEAIFKVAKEQPVRPFIVSAGAGEARALGTAFAVREEGGGAVVTVLESRVAVTYPTGALNRVELGSDQAVAFSGRGMESIQTVDAQDATAWQRGKLVFVDRPLGSVIEELNRYHSGRILITDAAIGDHHVSGVFDTKDPVSVVNALEASLGLKSTRLTSYLILLHL